jgi:hypothetical protein
MESPFVRLGYQNRAARVTIIVKITITAGPILPCLTKLTTKSNIISVTTPIIKVTIFA